MRVLIDRVVAKLTRKLLLRHRHECRKALLVLESEYEARARKHDGKSEQAQRMAVFLRGEAAGVRAALGKVLEVLGGK